MRIALIGVPYQLDVARWGYALGPQAFLDAGLARQLAEAGHTVLEPVWVTFPAEERTRDSVTNLGRIAARTARATAAALAGGADLALVLQGDCSHAVGAAGGLAQAVADAPVGIVWFDAHGDLHTFATTGTGYLGGMPYAVALGWDLEDWRLAAGLTHGVRAEAAALLGTSDLDPEEVEALRRAPLLHSPARDWEAPEAAQQVRLALRARAAEATAWYLHLDVDVAGPVAVPGAMTPAPTWPTSARLREMLGMAAETVPVRVLGLATYNPTGDPEGRGAALGIELVLAAVAALATRRA